MFQVDVDYLKKAKKRKDHGKVVILVFLTLAGAVSLLPLIYLVCTAFKPPEELFLYFDKNAFVDLNPYIGDKVFGCIRGLYGEGEMGVTVVSLK